MTILNLRGEKDSTPDLNLSIVASNTVSNIIETALATLTIPADFLTPGRILNIKASGTATNLTGSKLLRKYRLRFNSVTGPEIFRGRFARYVPGYSDMGWTLEQDVTIRTTTSAKPNNVFKHWAQFSPRVESNINKEESTQDLVIDTSLALPVLITVEQDISSPVTITNFTVEIP